MLSLSLFEFQQWDIEKQTDWLTENGSYISWRVEGEYNIYLYNMDNFFAEAWMHVRMGKIIKIICSKNSQFPGGYDQIVEIK